METIEMLINEIESEVLKAKKAPFSGTDVILSKAVMLELISRFRTNYPLALQEATQIKKERDAIMQKAEDYANETMDKAEVKANQLIDDTEIMRRAVEKKDAMMKEASDAYHKMDYDARVLAYNILNSSEKALQDGLAIIDDRKHQLVND